MNIDRELLYKEIQLYQLSGLCSKWLHLALYSISACAIKKFSDVFGDSDSTNDMTENCYIALIHKVLKIDMEKNKSIFGYVYTMAVNFYRDKRRIVFKRNIGYTSKSKYSISIIYKATIDDTRYTVDEYFKD